jgi:hypothetical protein
MVMFKVVTATGEILRFFADDGIRWDMALKGADLRCDFDGLRLIGVRFWLGRPFASVNSEILTSILLR